MNRIELLREYVDKIIKKIPDKEEQRCAYVHLYGVAQYCTLLALKRGENAELATMAGMLHDIYSYSKLDPIDHAHKGAFLAKEILKSLNITDETETKLICDAIYTHSDKDFKHLSFNEVLKDADVLQHCLYNITLPVKPSEKSRFEKLKAELNIQL